MPPSQPSDTVVAVSVESGQPAVSVVDSAHMAIHPAGLRRGNGEERRVATGLLFALDGGPEMPLSWQTLWERAAFVRGCATVTGHGAAQWILGTLAVPLSSVDPMLEACLVSVDGVISESGTVANLLEGWGPYFAAPAVPKGASRNCSVLVTPITSTVVAVGSKSVVIEFTSVGSIVLPM